MSRSRPETQNVNELKCKTEEMPNIKSQGLELEKPSCLNGPDLYVIVILGGGVEGPRTKSISHRAELNLYR